MAENHLKTIKSLLKINGILQSRLKNLQEIVHLSVTQALNRNKVFQQTVALHLVSAQTGRRFLYRPSQISLIAMKVMGDVIFDTLRKWEGVMLAQKCPGSISRALVALCWFDTTVLFSSSAITWSVCTRTTTKASANVTFSFAWVVPALHCWTQLLQMHKESTGPNLGNKKNLLGSVCQWPNKANNTNRAAHAATLLRVFFKCSLEGHCFPFKRLVSCRNESQVVICVCIRGNLKD